MDTPYLDAAIRLHDTSERIDKASDGAKEALKEFKAIKEALKQVENIAYEPVLADEAQRSELICPKCGCNKCSIDMASKQWCCLYCETRYGQI